MWLLVLSCIFQVDGVPINQTQNVTQNITGSVAPVIDLLQTSNAETLEEREAGMIVQEGDILILGDRNAVETLWTDASIPYTFDAQLDAREANILAAFKMITDHTCIRFHKRTTELNYLRLRVGKGCASYVGCQGGDQPLYYGQSCSVGNLCHELIHALGLHHEHTRPDRDKYITVQWQSIMSGRQKNFKMKHGNTLDLPYDLDSIMHYGRFFFTANQHPTILAKHDEGQMGQRTHLSPLDIEKLNKLYHCAQRENSMSMVTNGYGTGE